MAMILTDALTIGDCRPNYVEAEKGHPGCAGRSAFIWPCGLSIASALAEHHRALDHDWETFALRTGHIEGHLLNGEINPNPVHWGLHLACDDSQRILAAIPMKKVKHE